MFFAKGYEGSSLDEIVARAGGSKRNVYSHFGGKAGLLGAVVAKIAQELGHVVPGTEAGNDVRESLCQFACHFLQIIYRPRALAFWRMMIACGHRHPDAAELFLREGPQRAQADLSVLIERLARTGALMISDPQIAAQDFLAMLRGGRHLECLLGLAEAPTQAQQVVHAREITLRFLARHGSGAVRAQARTESPL